MPDGPRLPVHEGLFHIDPDGEVTLVGGWSPSAGLAHFPRRDVCPYTGAVDVIAVDLPRRGSLWAFTEVTAPPPGYLGAMPYGVGVVDLDIDHTTLRVVTRLVGATAAELRIGQAVELTSEEVPEPDGTAVTTWAFRPLRPGSGHDTAVTLDAPT